MKFVDRERELATLDRLWVAERGQFLVLYGRRSTGKTRLLTRWMETRKASHPIRNRDLVRRDGRARQQVPDLIDFIGTHTFKELCRGGDVVVKPLFGSEGRGMVRVSDPDVAHRVFRALELCRYIYYLQEFVSHGRQDIRVFVVGGEAVTAMVRRGETWKTNVAQGAKAEPLALDGTLRELGLRATRALGADYAGVDILPIESGGYTVIEVNGIPGWRALQAATGVDVADRLVEYALGESSG